MGKDDATKSTKELIQGVGPLIDFVSVFSNPNLVSQRWIRCKNRGGLADAPAGPLRTSKASPPSADCVRWHSHTSPTRRSACRRNSRLPRSGKRRTRGGV